MPDVSAGSVFVDIQPFLDQLGLAEKKADQLNGAVRAVGEATTKSFAAAAASQTQFAEKVAAGRAELAGIAAAARDTQAEIRRLTERGRELEQAIKKSSGADESKKWNAELAKNSEKIKEAKVNLDELRRATESERTAITAVVDARRKETTETKLTAAAAKDAAAAVKETQVSAEKSGNTFSELKGIVAAVFSIAAVKAFIGNVIEAGQATEAALSKLKFANGGDAQAAARDLAFLRAEADRLGLDLNSASNSYGSFTAAATAANFPLADARRLFQATAGAAATLKLSAGDTQGVLTALTQILSKGTVSAEELRGQIGERLPGAFSIAAKAVGVTEKELGKLLETGQLASSTFLPKFAAELEKTFGDGSAAAADSFSANLARIGNEFQAFFLRFEGTASSGLGRIAKFAKIFNETIDGLSSSGRGRLGEKQAQQGIQDYSATLDAIIAQRTELAKVYQQDVETVVAETLREVGENLAAQREAARKELAAASKAVNDAFLPSYVQKDRETDAARRLALLDGEIAKVNEVAAARKKANETDTTQGLIEKQELLIKALKARQKAATDENQGAGGDYLFGKGGLNKQITDAEKELKRLQGIIDKAAGARENKLAAALRALYAERATLEGLAAKAAIKEADDARTRSRLQYQEDLRQIEIIRQKLIEREKAVAKAGGRGVNADGKVDGVQQQQLNALAQKATDDRLERDYKASQKVAAYTNSLRELTDQQERDNLAARYQAEALLIQDNEDQRFLLREKYIREASALEFQINKRNSDAAASAGRSNATFVGNTFGVGAGQSVFQAKLKEKQLLLDIEKKSAQDIIDNAVNLSNKEAALARAAGIAQLAALDKQQEVLNRETKKADVSIYKLIFGENDSPELRAALDEVTGSVLTSLSQIAQAEQQAAAQKAGNATQNINELQSQLNAEIQLNKEGSASNIQGLQDQINEQRQIRKEALKDQRRAAQEQVVIDTITQASSIATAAANVFAAFSAIPFVGVPLGIGAAGLLVAAFVASKAKAFQAASQIGSGAPGFFRGGYTGGSDAHEERGVVHGKEFVHTAETTDKYRHPLFEALHAGRPQDIDWSSPVMRQLLPDYALPGKLREERAAQVEHNHRVSMEPLRGEFSQMHARLQSIEQTNRQMADKWDSHTLPDGNVMLVDPATGSTHLIIRG